MEEKPLGSDLEEPMEAEQPRRSFFSRGEVLFAATVALFLFSTLVPNFLKARARGQLTACESNLLNLATALEMYANNNKGHYPERLEQLMSGKYLKRIPTCPSRFIWDRKLWPGHDYTYQVKTRPDAFSMTCRGDHANAYKGFNADPHGFPQYSSVSGLLLHP